MNNSSDVSDRMLQAIIGAAEQHDFRINQIGKRTTVKEAVSRIDTDKGWWKTQHRHKPPRWLLHLHTGEGGTEGLTSFAPQDDKRQIGSTNPKAGSQPVIGFTARILLIVDDSSGSYRPVEEWEWIAAFIAEHPLPEINTSTPIEGWNLKDGLLKMRDHAISFHNLFLVGLHPPDDTLPWMTSLSYGTVSQSLEDLLRNDVSPTALHHNEQLQLESGVAG